MKTKRIWMDSTKMKGSLNHRGKRKENKYLKSFGATTFTKSQLS